MSQQIDRRKLNIASDPGVFVVSRGDIRAIESVEQDGVRHMLGELRDFRWEDRLAGFIPPEDQLSLSWVALKAGETLPPHTHPIQSMMVFHAGSGRVIGDLEQDISAGDVVVVPPGREHGFVAGPSGLSALSVQFGEGLYTNPDNARVVFSDDGVTLSQLLEHNQRRLREFQASDLFRAVKTRGLGQGELAAAAVSAWGRHTEVLAARCADGGVERAGADAAPADEEFPDAAVEAILTWFSYRMLVLDRVERVALVRLVSSPAWAAYQSCERQARAKAGVGAPAAEVVAPQADLAGIPVQSPATYKRIKDILDEAWDMLQALSSRVVELSVERG